MFLFYLLVDGLPCRWIFCQFWLCEEAQCVYLRRHLGSPFKVIFYYYFFFVLTPSSSLSCFLVLLLLSLPLYLFFLPPFIFFLNKTYN